MSQNSPRVTQVLAPGDWHAADTLTLPSSDRHLRRRRLVSDHGLELLLDLPRAVVLEDGWGLPLDDGRCVRVCAAPEPLLRVTAADAGDLIRVAWHLGNRHVPAALAADHVLVRADPVIAEMLAGLGATVSPVTGPFCPQIGAYGHGHGG